MLKKILLFTFLVLFLITTPGCVAVVAGAAGGVGTKAWLSGKLVQEIDATYEKTIKASKSALKSLKLNLVRETKTDEVTQIVSEYTDGRTIWIDVHKVSKKLSRVEIRVGIMGDEEAARKILVRVIKYSKSLF